MNGRHRRFGSVRSPDRRTTRRAVRGGVVLLVCLSLLVATVGQPAIAADVADMGAASAESEEVDPAAIDALMTEAMETGDAAGATVAVVEGEEIVHAEGYGYADYGAGEPVDPEETSFMVGSVAKPIVWTAVMQGVEDGTLDLEEPVGTYLDGYAFEGNDEVTLEHLGTHTPGYEDRLTGLFVADHDDVADWERKLEREMPTQVRAPGETVAYSNHGTGLAGLVLQEAHDEPFETHLEAGIFEPLEMDGATFHQPVPGDYEPISKGHVPTDDGFEATEPAVIGVPPAGSMSATATDMGNFAIAALQGGAFGDERILEEATVDAMTDERASNHPAVDGVGYGYMLGERGGETVVWHTGGTEHFGTLFALFPEHDVAIFASFNTADAPIGDLLDGFVEERFGWEEPTLEPEPSTVDRADAYEGEYRSTAFQTSHEKLVGLADRWTVSVTDEGYLELSSPGVGTSRWVEVEPGVFEPVDDAPLGVTTVAIEGDRLYLDAPSAPYERLAWYETTTAQGAFAVGALLVVLSTVLVWPASAYRRRGWGRMREHLVRPRLAVLVSLGLLLAFVLGLLANATADPLQFAYGFSLALRLTLGLLVVFALAAAVAVTTVALEWREGFSAGSVEPASTDRYGLAYLTVLAVALVVLVWQAWYWNLLTAAF